ncbi:MAG: DUF3575 domain-containing protein [Myxococcales bacterium]|nr:DUF3575 domain-containing protein [Myxococcales bacterium]
MRISVVLGALVVGPALAAAQAPHEPPPASYRPPPEETEPGRPQAPVPERPYALTVSPLHLLFPILEVTGEYRLGPRLGVAGTLGAGRITATSAAGQDLSFTAAELGGSVRYYVVGSFRQGVQLGAEVMYLLVKLGDNPDGVQAAGDGLSVGPFVGYKWTARGGFTVEAQLGIAITAIEAHATDGASTATEEQSRVRPLVNLNLGWSF